MSRVTDGPSLAPIIAFPTCTFSSHWHFQQRQSLLLRLLVFYNWLFKEIFFSLNISPLDIISVGSILSSESFLLSDLHTYLTFCCPYLTSNWTAHLSQQPEGHYWFALWKMGGSDVLRAAAAQTAERFNTPAEAWREVQVGERQCGTLERWSLSMPRPVNHSHRLRHCTMGDCSCAAIQLYGSAKVQRQRVQSFPEKTFFSLKEKKGGITWQLCAPVEAFLHPFHLPLQGRLSIFFKTSNSAFLSPATSGRVQEFAPRLGSTPTAAVHTLVAEWQDCCRSAAITSAAPPGPGTSARTLTE